MEYQGLGGRVRLRANQRNKGGGSVQHGGKYRGCAMPHLTVFPRNGLAGPAQAIGGAANLR
jgi:hypothetical protein